MATNSIVDYLNSQKQASDFTSRSALAQQKGIQGYTGTAEQNTQLLGMLQKPTPQANVTVPSSTNAMDLGTAKTPIAPPTETAPSPDPFVASLEASTKQFQSAYDEANKAVAPVQAERAGLTDRLSQSLDRLTGRGAAQVQAEEKLGIPQNIKQLQDLNVQIAQKKGEYDKRIAGLAGQGRGITTGIIQGQTAREQRMAAVELGSLASVAQAVQGNIALAQQTADRTVELEFADRQQEVNNLKTLLELNSENMSTAEKKRAEQLSFTLQERQNQIDTEKEERKNVLNLAAEAAKNGADNSTLTKMSQARTVEEAMQLAGEFIAPQQSSELDKLLSPAEAARLGVPYGTTRGGAIEGNVTPSFGRTTSSKSTPNSSGSQTVTTPDGKKINLSARTKSIYENPALLNQLTPTEKGKVLTELANQGLDLGKFAVENINAGQRETIAQYDDLVRQGKEAEVMLNETNLKTGPIQSRIQAGKALIGGAKDFTNYRSTVDNMSSTLIKLRSGAAVTPQEFERIKGFIPSINDDEKTAATKITKFYNEIETARLNYIKRATQTEQQILDSAVKQDQSNLRTKYSY